MRLRTKVVTMVLIAVVIMFGSFSVYALSWMHVPFEVESADGSKVFIFDPHPISPYYIRRTPSPMRMGVYYNTEPLQLIYRVSLEAISNMPLGENNLVFSECFRYMIFIPARAGGNSVAVEFYREGVLLQSYIVSDLVRHIDAPHIEVWVGLQWEDQNQRSFNPETNQLSITTIDGIFPFTSLPIGGRTFVFDITTGEIVARSPNVATPVFGVVIFIIIVSSVRIYKKRKAHEQIRAEEKMAR